MTDCSCRCVFFQQLKPLIDGGLLEKVDKMREVGLYLHKRHIRGDHGKMLEQAGTVLQHTLVYIKTADKVRHIAVSVSILPSYPMLPSLLKPSSNHSTPISLIVVTQVVAMDYGPKGSADVFENLTESVLRWACAA